MSTIEAQGPNRSRRPLLVGAGVVTIAMLVILPLFGGPWLSEDQKWPIVDVVSPLADLVAVALLVWRGRRSTSRAARRSWFLLAAGWSLFLVGDLSWSYVDFFSDLPYPPYSDLVYVTGTLLCLAGLVVFPVPGARQVSRTRLLLDAAVVASAASLIAFMVAVQEVFESLGTGFEAAANAFYPLADLLMVLVVLLLLMRSANRRLDLTLIGAAFASLVVADLSFAVGLLQHGAALTSLTSEPPYLLAPMLLALAALAPAEDPHRARRRKREAALMPDVAVLAALATIALQGIDGWGSGSLTLLTMALAVTRQVWLASENGRLRRDLERRVAQRTAEAEGLAQRQQRILQSVGEGIVGIDGRGRLSFANQTAERLLGAEPGALVGRDACTALHGVDAHESTGCPCRTAVGDGRSVSSEDQEFVRSDGSRLPAEFVASPHQDVTDPSVAVVVFRDITERRATEQMKAEFVSIVSHELRTPLTSIRGSLDLLADGDVGELSAPVARVVEIARRGSERLTRLVNDILVIERLDAGSLPMRFTSQPAVALTESAVGALAPIAGVEGITLEVDATPCALQVDADRYVQVLTNLVGNAIKFTPRGGLITVEVRTTGLVATVRVSDTGRGIPPDALDAVFNRFHQVDTDDRRVGGSGLGLAISRSIVEAHGGTIWAESEVGVGSAFSFTVPLERGAEPEPGPVDADPAAHPVERAPRDDRAPAT